MFYYNKYFKISSVIISYNDSDRIVKLVKKLLKFNIFDSIIISDNNSKLEEIEILSKLEEGDRDKIKVIFNKKNLGYAVGNNVGLEYLVVENVDFVFSINSDIDVEKEVVEKMIILLISHPECSISSCRMYEYGKEKQNFYKFPKISSAISENLGITKLFHIKPKPNMIDNEEGIAYVDFVRSSFCCMNYNDLKEIGFYDSNLFLYGGEATIGLKFKEINKKEIISLNDFYKHNHIYAKHYKMNAYKDTYKSFKYIFKQYLRIGPIRMFFYKCSYGLGFVIRKVAGIK